MDMAITTTVVRKTGIYQLTRTKADDQAGVRECIEGLGKWFNIDWQLEWIEEYALGVLHPQGVTAWSGGGAASIDQVTALRLDLKVGDNLRAVALRPRKPTPVKSSETNNEKL